MVADLAAGKFLVMALLDVR